MTSIHTHQYSFQSNQPKENETREAKEQAKHKPAPRRAALAASKAIAGKGKAVDEEEVSLPVHECRACVL